MPDTVLVVNMNYLGDALLTTPALRDLRRALPHAQIDTIVGAGPAFAALHNNPDIDSVVARHATGGLSRIAELYRLLRRGRYDMVVILPPLPAYGLAAWLARTPRRVGQGGRGMDFYLTERQDVQAVHMADRMRETMPVPQNPLAERRLYLSIAPDEYADARALLSANGVGDGFVTVNLGATRPQKRWTAAGFAGLLGNLRGTPCVLVGAGAHDEQLAADVLARTENKSAVNLVGRTTVKTLAAVLEAAAVLVSADSGPLHLATAVGTPVVSLFGSTDAQLTGPYDTRSVVLDHRLPCAPCVKNPTCGGRFECMAYITPDEVALAVRQFLRAPARTLEVIS